MWLLAERCQQIQATRFELTNKIIQPRLWANHVIIIGEDHQASLGGFHQAIATSRQADVVFGLDQSIDHCRFIRASLRKAKLRPAIIEDVDQRTLIATVLVNAAH
jgi:hypothetical protein